MLRRTFPDRIHSLEGMRGLAALSVYIHHFALLVFPAFYFLTPEIETAPTLLRWVAKTPLGVLVDGELAIKFFFIHSGFVLSYQFVKSGYKNEYNRTAIYSSALRRYFRLTIPMSTSIILAYILIKLGWIYGTQADALHTPNWVGNYYRRSYEFTDLLKQIFYENYFFFKSSKTLNPNLWTIAVELKASFLIYGLCLALHRFNFLWRSLLCFLPIFYFGLTSNYSCFCIGYFMAEIYIHKNQLSFSSKWAKLFLIIAIFYFGGVKTLESPIYSWIGDNRKIFYGFKIIGALALFITLFNSKKLSQFCEHRVVQFFGKISFALYLIHFPLFASLGSYLFVKGSIFWNFILVSFVSIGLSWLIYLLVDKPTIKILKRLTTQWLHRLEKSPH
jgi:peptidoglycan/LPS O-acetylase OafA/YrhL